MATTTQYNPNHDLNARLLSVGSSKTVYALVVPETEAAKAEVFGNTNDAARTEFLSQFREAWTGKQDALHVDFFNTWHEWSKPVVDIDRDRYPFFYPTAGASEPLRQIIFQAATADERPVIHFFEGEYEGYKAMAEAAGCKTRQHKREEWKAVSKKSSFLSENDLFFVSQPSAIDGNVWPHFNAFVEAMPFGSVVADVTYVGGIPQSAVAERFNLNAGSIRNIVFSLSKPFGLYYDRIGGMFAREEDMGLFGNKWFKSLSALRIGTTILKNHSVFEIPERYRAAQEGMVQHVNTHLGYGFEPADVFILATAPTPPSPSAMTTYLDRASRLRICLTPGMANEIGTGSNLPTATPFRAGDNTNVA